MKNILFRALRLYLKRAINPFSILFGLILMGGMILAFIFNPESVGSKEYISVVSYAGLPHVGVLPLVWFGSFLTYNNKFYTSSCCAKQMFTVVPVLVPLCICVIYDVALVLAAAVNMGSRGASDVLIISSVCGMLMLFTSAFLEKKKFGLITAFSWITFCAVLVLFDHYSLGGIGLPVSVAAAIYICVYAAGFIVTIILTNLWWKKRDGISISNMLTQNAAGE